MGRSRRRASIPRTLIEPPLLQILVGMLIITFDLNSASYDKHAGELHDAPGYGIDLPCAQALAENSLPIIIVPVTIHPAHVVAWIECIIVLGTVIKTGKFGFGQLGRGLVEDMEKVK